MVATTKLADLVRFSCAASSVDHCILRMVIRDKVLLLILSYLVVVVDNNLRILTVTITVKHDNLLGHHHHAFQDEDITCKDKINILNIVIVG